MAGKMITATDAARRFSDVLNQVRYQGARFDIVRGKEVVARLVPAAPRSVSTWIALTSLSARCPGWVRARPSPSRET